MVLLESLTESFEDSLFILSNRLFKGSEGFLVSLS